MSRSPLRAFLLAATTLALSATVSSAALASFPIPVGASVRGTFDGDAGGARSGAYRDGQKALDDGRWKDAAAIFRRVAAEKGDDADAALYWQAYALAKDGNESDALAALRELRASYPKSKWIDDGQALELEMRGPHSAGPSGSAAENEELKLYALNGLMQVDSARAIPVLQKFLQGNASARLKKQALFVLSQSDAPESRRLLGDIARGKTSPGLQREAIAQLGVAGGQASIAMLGDIYRESNDPEVKQAVLGAYLVSGAAAEVLAIARGDRDPAMRRRAIHQLGPMGANSQLRELYSHESSPELRRTILEAMGVAGDVEDLAQAARTETDPDVRRSAIHGLGVSGSPAAARALKQLYGSYQDGGTRRTVIEALFIMDDAKALIELFRAEKDAELRKQIVQKLSMMDSPEASELLLQMLQD
jgi:HEAT repeat protein